MTMAQFERELQQICRQCGKLVRLDRRSRFCSMECAVRHESKEEAA